MHTVIEPSFYHELNTNYKSNGVNLWESPEGLKALARNMHFVKTWRSDLLFVVYYHHSLVAFDTINNAPSSTLHEQGAPPSTGASQTVLQLFSETTRDTFPLIPLPPMTELTTARLDMSANNKSHNKCSYFLLNYSDPYTMTIRLCGILEHFPQLRELDLLGVLVPDSWSAHLFMSTVQRMDGLTTLAVDLTSDSTLPGLTTLILFECPTSIKSLGVTRQKSKEDTNPTSSATMSHWKNTGTMQANLRNLRLSNWGEGIAKDDFLSILEGCPNLEKLSLECGLVPVAVTGADISRVCPNLRDIAYHWISTHEFSTTLSDAS
ncbi:hypothetical protein BGX24_011961 [Mortierella sp. AD032]|nr:hypothetical protein BGX24_011961 [Mortierella sp. AD032]